jgi:hypothetical protein
MTEDTKNESLLSRPASEYGKEFNDHLLEQYKIYVQSAQDVSERRLAAGNYLLTINSSLVTLFGVVLSSFGNHRWNVVIPITGILACIVWHSLVESYKTLNTAKFAVIHQLENYLPVALFRYEWHVCDYGKTKKYVPLTHLERYIPWLFGTFYVALACYALLGPVDRKESASPAPPVTTAQPAQTIRAVPEKR